MNYVVTHTTTYRYSSPVSICHNVLMLEPRRSPSLRCNVYQLDIEPAPKIRARREDMFGNFVHRFSLEENHSVLKIIAKSSVTVQGGAGPVTQSAPACEEISHATTSQEDANWLEVAPFLFDSPRIKRSAEFAEYAKPSVQPDRPVFNAVLDLTQRIYTDFKYDKDATLVDTPTELAFDGRHGVCQDFAHVAVACLRSCSLPARYVSGYLRTVPAPGTKRLIGNDESHAWFSVYCGSEAGWIDFDPTNNCVCGTDHVPIAFGRDYSDVVPVKGIFLGGGKTTMNVSVDVAPTG